MQWLLSGDDFWHPQLSYSMQCAFRAAYGFLLFFTLVQCLPHWRRFFVCEKWGGYAKSAPDVDILQSPVAAVIIAIAWFASAACICLGLHTIEAAAINLLFCRYFFVHMRWKGILRGMGAPGLMSYWLSVAVFALEVTSRFAPNERALALLVLQTDFAFIMFTAGLYKLNAGYPKNEGMEYGMANPEWGYWWKFFKNVPPSSLLFKVLNHLAWGTEMCAAVLMLFPPTRFVGGSLILLSFIFIATQIRLGLLCEMVIVCCFLFFHPGSLGDQLVNLCLISPPQAAPAAALPWLSAILHPLLTAYLCCLPLAYGGMFYNFYGKKAFAKPVQLLLEKYTNFFGMIVWRVFSVDVTNFFIQVYFKSRDGEQRQLYSKYGWEGGFRYDSVAECITITTLFTTLKYYSSNVSLFNERLFRYARTIPCPADCVLEFDYVSIKKHRHGFEFVPVSRFVVDTVADSITERPLDESISIRAAHAVSPVHEGAKPGSYVPLGN